MTKTVNLANLPSNSISFPLKEPSEVIVDREYDYQLYKKLFAKKDISQRFWKKIHSI